MEAFNSKARRRPVFAIMVLSEILNLNILCWREIMYSIKKIYIVEIWRCKSDFNTISHAAVFQLVCLDTREDARKYSKIFLNRR